MSESSVVRPTRSMRNRIAIHCVLVLLYFLPGGLVWNRVDPLILGIPFGVFVTALLLPGLIIVNMIVYVRGQWADDTRVSAQVRREAPVEAPPVTTAPAVHAPQAGIHADARRGQEA